MKQGYGQYCPLALAAELLGQRWTVLVISRLIDGCTTFNEIHRGVPRISPSLLSRRLTELEDYGLLVREQQPGKSTYRYILTEAGWDLEDIIMQLAVWGQHWARDMVLDDLDPAFLAWSMHMRINTNAMPAGRTVLEFDFSGTPQETYRFWLVNNDGKVDMCLKHPGFDADLVVSANLKLFVEVWRGFRSLQDEIAAKTIKLEGPRKYREALPEWLLLSALAPFPRKRDGRELEVARQHACVPQASDASRDSR